jgi:hypothetical protein
MMTKKIFFLADPLPTMRKNILLTNSNKPFIGYDNVVYEESILIPDSYDWIYFIPQEGIHFYREQIGVMSGLFTPISPYQLYYPNINTWTSSEFTAMNDYYSGRQYGRYWGLIPAHMDWQQTANLGFKTIAEYNALLSQMDNATKRNLTGTRIYS